MRSNSKSSGAANDILSQLGNRPKFCERRDLAFTRPERARDKLQSYSTLELKVVKARNLTAADLYASDPYAEIFVDDVFKGKTQTVLKTLNPSWNWDMTIDIKHPASVLLLRVLDSDQLSADDPLGFVEFPVVDLPLDKRISGWFRLAPPEKLLGKAPERMKNISEHREESCGAVYLEATRRIVSGDPEDESYAWCLPQQDFQEYPESGWLRVSLDAQALIDSIMDFKTALLGGLIRPLMRGVGFILGWHNVPMTLMALGIAVGISYRPEYFLSGLFLLIGLVLLLLSDPAVFAAMALQPATVPLTDAGYKLIAQTKCTDTAVGWLNRVVSTIQGKVVDEDALREFAAFLSYEGETVADSYVDLKRQVHDARTTKQPFLNTDEKPLKQGALVQRRGKKGEVVSCVNEKEILKWTYEVQFDGAEKPEKVSADELESRTDMRWMSDRKVLAFIPDSVEDSLVGWTIFFRSLTTTLEGVEQPIRDIACWTDKVKSLSMALACLALSVLFIWVQRIFFIVMVSLLFAKNTDMWIAFFAKRQGKAAYAKQQSEKRVTETLSHWGFFEAEEAAEEEKTPLLQSFMRASSNMFSKQKT